MAAILGAVAILYEPSRMVTKREVRVQVEDIHLGSSQPEKTHRSELIYLGGLEIRSADKGFTGFSGLILEGSEPELTMIAVTDGGDRFEARLEMAGGKLSGLDHATLEPLVDLEGRPLQTKKWSDAESIARLPDGRVLVGFERRHRIWAYGPHLSGRPRVFETPPSLPEAPANGGLESIAVWPDGRILAITERLHTRGGSLAAFLYVDGAWADVEWQPTAPGFEPSDAIALPGGDLLVLERYWSLSGPSSLVSRVVRVPLGLVKPGASLNGRVIAELGRPLIAENFEGLAVFVGLDGRDRLVMVSDDPLGRLRTVVLMFALAN